MSYTWQEESRKRILGRVAQHLHDEGAKDIDGFSSRLISRIANHVEEHGEFPKNPRLQALMTGTKTALFKVNHHLRKTEVASWIADLLTVEEKTAIHLIPAPPNAGLAPQAIRISVDDIDSFRQVSTVAPHRMKDLVPLAILESDIKNSIAEIVGEPFIPKDWGGEIADLFSSHVVLQGKRVASGFLLKGRGTKGTLRIKTLGKNGDQVVRLTSTSLDLYVVQFVGLIDQAVIAHLEAHVRQAAEKAGLPRYYCVIDGTDTARLLKAYGKL